MSKDATLSSYYLNDEKIEEIQFDVEVEPVCQLSANERQGITLEYRTQARKIAHGILAKWHCHLDFEEFNSVVDLSLCEAASRFDPSRGVSFITFLFYSLRGNLIRTIKSATKESVVSVIDECSQIQESVSFERNSKILTEAESIEAINSLNGKEGDSPEKLFLDRENASVIAKACEKLDKVEKEVIYYLYVRGEHVLATAASLGYSRCHVSRIKKSALEHLKKEMSKIYEEGAEDNAGKYVSTRAPRQITRRRPRSQRIMEGCENKQVVTMGM